MGRHGSMSIKSLTVVTPTFHCKELILIFIKSFEKFKPSDLTVNYIVVENSMDVSYKEDVLALCDNITWVNNDITLVGSAANASGVEKGLEYVKDQWVFIAHCDVCVASELFYSEMFQKIEEGYKLIGTVLDPCKARIGAIHISGYMMGTDMARKINFYPRELDDGEGRMDVGDEATLYCRQNDIQHYCFENTFNDASLTDVIDDKYKALYCDRCLNSRWEVIFLHLGRGIPKTEKTYDKPGKTYLEHWIDFCYNEVLID